MSSNHIVIGSHFIARLLSRGGEAELLSAADRLDIMDLVHTVGWCIDARSYEVLAQITTEKFQLDMPTDKVDGRAKFIEFLKNGKTFQGLRHQNTNILMRSIDLENAIAVSHLTLIKVTNKEDDSDDKGDGDGNASNADNAGGAPNANISGNAGTGGNSDSNSGSTSGSNSGGGFGNTSGIKDDALPAIVVQAVCTDVLKSEKDIWKLAKRTIDQMCVSSAFVSDESAREKFAMTAKERNGGVKAGSK
jgi:hypothetical protein